MDTVLFSSGEFSRLCGISRESLIYYDKKGLLKPHMVAENGYRYYSADQLYLFEVVRFFLDAGMTIKELRNYLANRSTDLFLSTIDEALIDMQRQRGALESRIEMMERMRYITQRSLIFPKGEPRLSLWEPIWLVTTSVMGEHSEQSYIQAMSRHSHYCRNVANIMRFPLGRVVSIPDHARPQDYRYEKLFTWTSPQSCAPLEADRVEQRQGGKYAVILHRGGTSSVVESYRKLLSFIRDERYRMIGPLYELDVNSYLMSKASEDFLLHISVLVDT